MHRTALFLLLIISLLVVGCGSGKYKTKTYAPRKATLNVPTGRLAVNVVNNARRFQGTPYHFGGTTRKGMDCSGLVYVAFQQENIQLPRVSRNMAKEGRRIKTEQVNVGDLLFFRTNRAKRINHVGLVVDILPGQILFIHSTSSRGVIISSLNEGYWNNAYVQARKVI